jgi:anaerobic magnesium-protoporphyrin IX monomethyl ester cyclase
MARILLINPTYSERSLQKSIPNNLLAVAAVLQQNGHKIQIVDSHSMYYNPEQAFQAITNLKFDIIGISGITTAYSFFKKFVKLFRQEYGSTIPIMAGGPIAATMPEIFLKYIDADAVCTGCGEPVVNELVDGLLHKRPLDNLGGIAYREGNGFVVKPGLRVNDMDKEVPIPPYDLLNMDRYRRDDKKRTLELAFNSSRGCPFNCAFCSPGFGRGYIKHSVDNFIERVAFAVEKYSPDLFRITDELFTANNKWVIEFCEKYRQSGMGLPWMVASRVNTVDKELLSVMKDAGCYQIGYGIESGSPVILKEINKKVTVEQNLRAMQITKEVGMEVGVCILLGAPSETEETIEETKSMLIEADIREFGINFPTAYPGSSLFEYAVSKGLIQDIDKYLLKTCCNADKLLINYTNLDDSTLKRKKIELVKDVAYAWHIKRGILCLLGYKLKLRLRNVKNAINLLREKGFIALLSKIAERVRRKT